MNPGGSRLIAAQSVVVGVLMVVVFLTLLRPEAGNDWFGITTPGETVVTQPDGREPDRRDRGPREPRRADRRSAPPPALGAGVPPQSPIPAQPTAPAPALSPPATPGGGGVGPAEDQYGDAVALLAARLR